MLISVKTLSSDSIIMQTAEHPVTEFILMISELLTIKTIHQELLKPVMRFQLNSDYHKIIRIRLTQLLQLDSVFQKQE